MLHRLHFFDVPQLIKLKQKEEICARGRTPLNSSKKYICTKWVYYFETQHTVPRLMGGFANADARGLLDSCHHSAFEANMQKEKHPSYMSKTTYLSFI